MYKLCLEMLNEIILDEHSESANLDQRCQIFRCVRQVAALYIRRRLALSSNGKESFNPILDSDADPNHRQNLSLIYNL